MSNEATKTPRQLQLAAKHPIPKMPALPLDHESRPKVDIASRSELKLLSDERKTDCIMDLKGRLVSSDKDYFGLLKLTINGCYDSNEYIKGLFATAADLSADLDRCEGALKEAKEAAENDTKAANKTIENLKEELKEAMLDDSRGISCPFGTTLWRTY